MNLRQLNSRITLLKYISKTFQSIESITINRRNNLNNSFQHLKNGIIQLMQILSMKKNKNIPKNNQCIIIIASDTSLCGPYNTQVTNYGAKWIKSMNLEETIDSPSFKFIIIGKKIHKSLETIINNYCKNNRKVEALYYSHKEINNGILDSEKILMEHGWDTTVIHNGKNNTECYSIGELLKKIKHNFNLEQLPDENHNNLSDYFLEGDYQTIYNSWEQLLFHYLLIYSLYEAQIAETTARLYFLKSSIENCQEEINHKTQEYRRLRQEIITNEINCIISSSLL